MASREQRKAAIKWASDLVRNSGNPFLQRASDTTYHCAACGMGKGEECEDYGGEAPCGAHGVRSVAFHRGGRS